MSDYELYLSEQPQEKWVIVDHGERGGERKGAALIIQASQKEITDAIEGKINFDTLPPWYQGHLKVKGFVGILLTELKKLVK